MNTLITLIFGLSVFFSGQGLIFTGLFILNEPLKDKKSLLLLSGMLMVSLIIFYYSLHQFGPKIDKEYFIIELSTLTAFIAPLYYLYVSSFKCKLIKRKHYIWHFTPSIFFIGLYVAFSVFSVGEPLLIFFVLVKDLLCMVYIVYTYKFILGNNPKIKPYVKGWLLPGILLMGFALFISDMSVFFDFGRLRIFINVFFMLSSCAFLLILMGIYLIQHKKVYLNLINIELLSKVLPNEDEKKYVNSGLSAGYSKALSEKLYLLMKSKELYKRSDVSLSMLASELSISRHHMSEVINSNYEENFYDFINRFRIEEATKLLSSSTDLNIEEIGLKVGYNNKVSFYNAFKKNIKCTPTQYKKQLLKEKTK